MRAAVLMMVLSLVLLSTAAWADVPGLINYQGTLTDSSGAGLDTTVSMTFTIYSDSTGGSKIWTETQSAVVVSHGLFNVLLGSVNAIQDTIFNAASRWLGVKVGGDPETGPLKRIVTVGYAFRAAEADTARYAHTVPVTSDGDWTISGNNMYSAVPGSVAIGWPSPIAKLYVFNDDQAVSVYSSNSSGVYALSGDDISVYGSNMSTGNTGYLGSPLYGAFGSSVNGQGVYGTSTNNYAGFFIGGRGLYVNGSAEVTDTLFSSTVSSRSPLLLQTSGITRICVNDTSGNVGIGTTNLSALRRLDVQTSAGIGIYGHSHDSTYAALYTQNPGGGPAAKFYQGDVIVDLGNVGVGTDSTTAKLDVEGATGYAQLRLRIRYTPSHSGDTNGNVGDIAWDNNYVYIKTGTGWKRALLVAF